MLPLPNRATTPGIIEKSKSNEDGRAKKREKEIPPRHVAVARNPRFLRPRINASGIKTEKNIYLLARRFLSAGKSVAPARDFALCNDALCIRSRLLTLYLSTYLVDGCRFIDTHTAAHLTPARNLQRRRVGITTSVVFHLPRVICTPVDKYIGELKSIIGDIVSEVTSSAATDWLRIPFDFLSTSFCFHFNRPWR